MPNSYIDTYRAIGDREDLIDVVNLIDYEETLFKSRIGGTQAKYRLHEWQVQDLAASNSANAKVEGSATTFASGDSTLRTRQGNYTQILEKPWSVSYTQMAVEVAGVADEYAEQRRLKTIEIMRDLNSALINQTSASGDSATARTMQGALAAITTNATAAGANEKVNQPLYNKLMRLIWLQGGRPNACYVRGYNKQAISSWTMPTQRHLSQSESKTLYASFDKYDSDFGTQLILPEREMPDAQVMVVEEKHFKVAYLRPLEYKEISENGGSQRGRIETEATLEYRAENSSGKITGLTFES